MIPDGVQFVVVLDAMSTVLCRAFVKCTVTLSAFVNRNLTFEEFFILIILAVSRCYHSQRIEARLNFDKL